jgi:pyrroloquinoline quinone (PQQ) biosynthesis protein C
MDTKTWRKVIGDMVKEHWRSPELEHYFSVKMTKARAQVMLKELAVFVRHRRDGWAYVAGNCPEWPVKQKILEHEYGEVIKDRYSEYGHLDLLIRQGKEIGLRPEDILHSQPLPITRATLYAWCWITKDKSWIEGLAALSSLEWTNDDRLLADQGGGHSTRMAKKWIEEMGMTWEQLPNFVVHREADEDHSDMFLPYFEKFGTGEREKAIIQAVRESLDLYALYREGVAQAMEKVN